MGSPSLVWYRYIMEDDQVQTITAGMKPVFLDVALKSGIQLLPAHNIKQAV